MKFEEVLPALRAGKRVRLYHWAKNAFLQMCDGRLVDERNENWTAISRWIFSDKWEVVTEPIRMADYLCPVPGNYMHRPIYAVMLYEVGTQPKGAVLVPGTERDEVV